MTWAFALMMARTAVVAVVATLAAVGPASAAVVNIENADPVGQGLNDPAPFTPVGGNNATTLGGARMAVFQRAGQLWGAQLASAVPIQVSAQMTALACDATSAVIASTGAASVHRDFPSAPLAATWYPQALANALAGIDLAPSTPDIETRFNSSLGDAQCEPGVTLYLGLDGHPGPAQIDMLTVVLHELAHGLGFASFADFSTGAKFGGLDDAFLTDMQEAGVTPSVLSEMTDGQRASAAVSDPNLYWAGPHVQGDAGTLSAGLVSGHVRLYAPATFQSGSSASHYSTALTPNQLMEPYYTGPTRDLALTTDLLVDIGWLRAPAVVASVPSTPLSVTATLLAALTIAGAWSVTRRSPRWWGAGGRARRAGALNWRADHVDRGDRGAA